MRVAVYVLILVNLLYFGWAEWIDVPAPPPTSSIAGLPPLTLLSDLPPAKRAALGRKMGLQTPQQCVSVGPFDDPAVAAQALDVLKAKSFAPQQRAVEMPAIRRFWVYLDAFRSDASEMRVLHRLERAGIDDAEAMPPAVGGRKVSLGLFTDKDRAGRRMKTVQTMGFKPVMAQRMLPGTVYWLDLALPNSSTAVPLKDVSSVEPAGDSAGISVQPCPSASPPGAPTQQTASPAGAPATPAGAAAKTASSAAAAAHGPPLPICKPGGRGPVPCIIKKTPDQSSVL
ncbi:MAG: hypothetical protein ACRETR_03935 [Steroidobacteraceae bacterium]